MAIDFKTFGSVVNAIVDARHPVLIRGRHGIGKSETVYAYAKSVGKPVVERRASQMTEGDLVGLPVVSDDRTSWNPPDWYKQACDSGVVLFMDEIDRAVQEVRQGFFQLTDSRTINGHRLHPDTVIFAAVNGGTNGAQYSVSDMDPAELDRWTVFDVEPSVEDWLDFATADGRIATLITDFIRDNHTHLEHKGEFEPSKKYPSRRSWTRFNDTVRSMLETEHFKTNLNAVYQIGTGYLGFEAAVAFKDFANNYEKQVSVNDILVDGKFDLTKGFKLNEHITMVGKLIDSKRLVHDMPVDQLTNAATYFFKLPSEAAMKFYTGVAQGDADIRFLLAMYKLPPINGVTVKSYINELLDAKGKKKKA